MSATISPDVGEAIAAVRDDSSEVDWCLASYEDTTSIGLIGQGSGGVEELVANLRENDVCYGLLRRSFMWESAGAVQANTTKFIFVYFRPDTIPLKRKMKMGIFEGQLKSLFSPYHVDMDIADPAQLSEGAVAEVLDTVTMRGSKVTTAAATGAQLSMGASSRAAPTAPKFLPTGTAADTHGVAKGAQVSFSDEAAIRSAMADVRHDGSATTWAYMAYHDKATVGLVASGEGGLDEAKACFQQGQWGYALLRVEEAYDMSTAVRFVMLAWQPEDVAPMTRAAMLTHRAAVLPLLRPYLTDFTFSSPDDYDIASIMATVGGLTGTRSHVTSRRVETKEEAKVERQYVPGMSSSAVQQELPWVSPAAEEEMKAAIAAVRNDSEPADFAVGRFDGTKFTFTAGGEGGMDALVNALSPDTFSYGLLRLTEVIDRSVTTKFCYVKYFPEAVPPQLRGRLGILQGAVAAVFAPYHGDIESADTSDFTPDAALGAVSKARRASVLP
eukprot:CAMPEP_0198434676 /NCGR_PEP_ID=MMETSP1452-20131203/33854_1 /TAXON_ID=1181717 /ORGANISM="Synchroma pusillum, Strain CCMP3072" /LENGTH=498 /DNA_ID=CAMNT_0044155193 /DNA_START=32 /DNA_END=1528 /DNA_ORIENTATION=+